MASPPHDRHALHKEKMMVADLDNDLSKLTREELEQKVKLLRRLYVDTLARATEAQDALDEIHARLSELVEHDRHED